MSLLMQGLIASKNGLLYGLLCRLYEGECDREALRCSSARTVCSQGTRRVKYIDALKRTPLAPPMKYSNIVTLVFMLVNVVAETRDLNERISGAQKLLLAEGPSLNVLNEYDGLIKDIESSNTILNAELAQVYYKKALVAIGINKRNVAAQDLSTALRLDADFSPAADKLVQMWFRSGQFSDIRSNFSKDRFPEVFQQMEQWEATYKSIESALGDNRDIAEESIQEFAGEIAHQLIAWAPDCAAGYELEIRLAKHQAARGKAISFDNLAKDYNKVTRLSGPRDLAKYASHSQFLLFIQGKFQDAWNTVKNCLRVDNEFSSCGRLSKLYSKLQAILKTYEEYYVVDEYLYGGTSAVLPEDKRELKLDPKLYHTLASPVKLSKKEMAQLPPDVHTNLEYLRYMATSFCLSEFPGVPPETLPFINVLNKFACELSIEAKSSDRKKVCARVIEDDQPFLPKHLGKVDSLLKKKKYDEAKQILEKYSENVRRTEKYQKRIVVIKEHEDRVNRERQQEFFQQSQQRFFQQNQQNSRGHSRQQHYNLQPQSQFDRSKDYYKILDIPKDADEKTIKKAFRTQTLKYHPDKYKGGDLDESAIATKMQEINEAYKVLSDPDSKADYDRGGAQEFHGRGGPMFHQQPSAQDIMAQFMQANFKL